MQAERALVLPDAVPTGIIRPLVLPVFSKIGRLIQV